MKSRHRGFFLKLSVAGALLGALAGALSLAGCGGGDGVSVADTAAAPASGSWRWTLPAGFPVPAVPADNPMSEAGVDLGRHLFYDKRLSGNGTQACASCHLQDRAFTDGFAVSQGSTGQFTHRSAQHLGNVAYNPTLTWANPSLLSLEKQMEVPLFSEDPVEMGLNDSNKAQVLQRLADLPLYQQKFTAAFAGQGSPINWNNVIKAIASFQRSMITGNSKYDQFVAGKAVFTPTELRGMNLFFGEKAECFHCHGSFNFNDQVVHASTRVLELPFSNTGLFNIGGTGAFPEPNRGVFELSGLPRDMGMFRAPSLRNVEVTAPYTHDGSIETLEGMLDFYAAGGRNITSGPHAGDGRLNPLKSDLIALINLDAQEKADIVAFLKTLTDHDFLTNPKLSSPFPAP
ncbi:MbnH family di-heme enzyme [Polaromonas sp.]|uniref:MbnH family di-heme enzyme n=1 Tax=Polaromonas sp. TaxID=1869339 RepID=UPI003BB6042D